MTAPTVPKRPYPWGFNNSNSCDDVGAQEDRPSNSDAELMDYAGKIAMSGMQNAMDDDDARDGEASHFTGSGG